MHSYTALALAAFQNFCEPSQQAARRHEDNEKRAEGRKRVARAGFDPLVSYMPLATATLPKKSQSPSATALR